MSPRPGKSTRNTNFSVGKSESLKPLPIYLRRNPGVLVGRLGTNIEFAKQGFGSAVMDFIKAWFRSDENKTDCRFIIVDAINKPEVIHYYQKNNFKFLL